MAVDIIILKGRDVAAIGGSSDKGHRWLRINMMPNFNGRVILEAIPDLIKSIEADGLTVQER